MNETLLLLFLFSSATPCLASAADVAADTSWCVCT